MTRKQVTMADEPLKITPLGWKLLWEKGRHLATWILENKRELGDLARGDPGDGFHDGLFLDLQMKVQMREEQLQRIEATLAEVRVVSKPDQVDTVAIGHRVVLGLRYPGGESEEIAVILLGTADIGLVKEYLVEDEVPISDHSALGSAIHGVQTGNDFQYTIDAGIVYGTVVGISVWNPAFEVDVSDQGDLLAQSV